MTCWRCGSQNKDDAKFCINCGSKLYDMSYTVPNRQQQANTSKLKWYHWVIIVLAVLSIFDLYENVERLTNPAQDYIDNQYLDEKYTVENMVWLRPTDNSEFVRIGYDEENETLGVTFKSNGTYYYFDFSYDDWEAFINASNIGDYYDKHIKGKYHGSKVG